LIAFRIPRTHTLHRPLHRRHDHGDRMSDVLRWTPVLGLVLLGVYACGSDPAAPPDAAAEVRVLSSPEPSGTSGRLLADSVVVEVRDAAGAPLAGAAVRWRLEAGGQIVPASYTTDGLGRVSAAWTLGLAEGPQELVIEAGTLAPARVRAAASTLHAASVVVGDGAACALTAEGRALCWGYNSLGQLGTGQLGNGTVAGEVKVPVPVAGGLRFIALSASNVGHTCGLTADLLAYCWGDNFWGQTGTGLTAAAVPQPTAVSTSERFTQLSAGGGPNAGTFWGGVTCGRTDAGRIWCWGDNSSGVLGDRSLQRSNVPVLIQTDQTFASVEVGRNNACALTFAGALWCWGLQDLSGLLGSLPAGYYTTPVRIMSERAFIEISPASGFGCGLTQAHRAFCWGDNLFGALGSGLSLPSSPIPVAVAGGHDFVSITSSSVEETMALSATGTAYRWGSPGGDQPQHIPVEVVPQLTFARIDAGMLFGPVDGACGITTTGAVYCFKGGEHEFVEGVPVPASP
jgi:hypothetical protein